MKEYLYAVHAYDVWSVPRNKEKFHNSVIKIGKNLSIYSTKEDSEWLVGTWHPRNTNKNYIGTTMPERREKLKRLITLNLGEDTEQTERSSIGGESVK